MARGAPAKKLPARARLRRHDALLGVVLVILAGIGLVLGYTKHIPFTGYGFELKADFNNPNTLRVDSPVRIAGVNVGKVISVDPKGEDMAEVTFTVADEGLPVN